MDPRSIVDSRLCIVHSAWSILDSAWWGETTEWRIRHIYSAYEPALGAWGYRWIIWLSSSPSWLLSWQLCTGFITTSFFSGTVLWKGSVLSLADVDTFMISFYLSDPSPIIGYACHSLTDWLLFSKLDWCDPGVWICLLKTCWGCFCCQCWWWGSG